MRVVSIIQPKVASGRTTDANLLTSLPDAGCVYCCASTSKRAAPPLISYYELSHPHLRVASTELLTLQQADLGLPYSRTGLDWCSSSKPQELNTLTARTGRYGCAILRSYSL